MNVHNTECLSGQLVIYMNSDTFLLCWNDGIAILTVPKITKNIDTSLAVFDVVKIASLRTCMANR